MGFKVNTNFIKKNNKKTYTNDKLFKFVDIIDDKILCEDDNKEVIKLTISKDAFNRQEKYVKNSNQFYSHRVDKYMKEQLNNINYFVAEKYNKDNNECERIHLLSDDTSKIFNDEIITFTDYENKFLYLQNWKSVISYNDFIEKIKENVKEIEEDLFCKKIGFQLIYIDNNENNNIIDLSNVYDYDNINKKNVNVDFFNNVYNDFIENKEIDKVKILYFYNYKISDLSKYFKTSEKTFNLNKMLNIYYKINDRIIYNKQYALKTIFLLTDDKIEVDKKTKEVKTTKRNIVNKVFFNNIHKTVHEFFNFKNSFKINENEILNNKNELLNNNNNEVLNNENNYDCEDLDNLFKD